MTLDELLSINKARQPVSINDIIAGIQSQYAPVQQGQVQQGAFGSGVGQFVNGVNPNAQQPMAGYTPAQFANQAQQTQAGQTASLGAMYGTSSGGSSGDSGLDTGRNYASGVDAFLQADRVNKMAPLVGMAVPFGKQVVGGAARYGMANAANEINTLMSVLGGQSPSANPALAAASAFVPFGGALMTQDAIDNARALAQQFGSSEVLGGYVSAAGDPQIGAITDALAANAGADGLTPAQYGAIGLSVGTAVQNNIAKGMSLNDATQAAATAHGLQPSQAAAIAANLNTADPVGQLISNLGAVQSRPAPVSSGGSSVSQSAIDAANRSSDPIGSLISSITSGGSSSGGSNYSGGGTVTDSSGNPVSAGSGGSVSWGGW